MRNSIFAIALLCLIVLSCSPRQAIQPPEPTVASSPTAAPRPTLPGDKVDVGGYQLYLYCTGTGSPTVILEAGLEGDDISWKEVQPKVAQFTRVCSYDRAGLAHSDYGPTPRNAE